MSQQDFGNFSCHGQVWTGQSFIEQPILLALAWFNTFIVYFIYLTHLYWASTWSGYSTRQFRELTIKWKHQIPTNHYKARAQCTEECMYKWESIKEGPPNTHVKERAWEVSWKRRCPVWRGVQWEAKVRACAV